MEQSNWHLAQINIAKMVGVNINDPVMASFVAQLEEINSLAESSKGFVWRLKDEDNNATNFNPYNNERIIVNMTVSETIEDLQAFVYNGRHVEVLKNRRAWFEKFGKVFMSLWYIPAGHIPSFAEANQRLDHLHEQGPTQYAFDFKVRFPPPLSNQIDQLSATPLGC